MSTKRSGKSTTLTFDSVNIGQITDISGPSLSKNFIDATSFDSAGSYREFIGGLRDPGEVSLTVILNPSSSTDNKLRSNFDLDTDENKVVSIDLAGSGTSLDFSGSISALGHTIPLDDLITQEVTIRVSGPVTVNGSAWT